jgi:SAM-dependent methyltransferase
MARAPAKASASSVKVQAGLGIFTVSGWADGYVTEIEYLQGYHAEVKPLVMRHALLNQGIQHRWPARLRYLELGFGQGLSLNIHAAAMPGEFWGCDFNPAHAANALEMATASGANVRILDDSFEELARRSDLPTFDIIALHGIWSWVSDANRRVIVDIARRHLAVGGVFYVSYNTTPGWSAAMPLRHLLNLHAEEVSAEAQGLPARLDAALDFAQSLADVQAAYFRANPVVVEKLKHIRGQRHSYSVHEYLTGYSQPMAFSDVARDLAEAKLSFATTTFLLEQISAFCLTADQQRLLEELQHPVLRESVRDCLVNQQFRRDLWVKGLQTLTPRTRTDLFMSQAYTLATPPEAVPFRIPGPIGEVELQEAAYRPVIAALAGEAYVPKTLAELCALAPTLQPQQVVEVVTVLCGTGHVMPVQVPEAIRQAKPVCDRLNAHFIERAVHAAEVSHLASPVVGGGIGLDRFHQLFLRALKAGKRTAAEWAEDTWAVLAANGQRLTKEGRIIETPEGNLAELKAQALAFEAQQLPVLRALQVA